MENETIYGICGVIVGAIASRVYYKHQLSKFAEATIKTITRIQRYCFHSGYQPRRNIEGLRLRDSMKDLGDLTRKLNKNSYAMNEISSMLEDTFNS